MAATRIAGTTSTTSSAPPPPVYRPARRSCRRRSRRTSRSRRSSCRARSGARCSAIYGFARLVDDIGDETTGDRDGAARLARGRPRPRVRRASRSIRCCAALAPTLASSAFPARAVPPPDRGEPAGPGGVALRHLRRPGRLLRPVGEPGRRARAVRVPRGDAGADRAVGLASAPRCSSPSTGRTSARTTGAAAIYLPARTSSASASTRTTWLRHDAENRSADLLAFEVERARGAARRRARRSSRSLAGRARIAVAGYVGGGRAALDAIERGGLRRARAARRRATRRRARAARRCSDVLREAR